MKIFKTINVKGQVSHHTDVKKAIKTNPQVIFEQRGLIVKR